MEWFFEKLANDVESKDRDRFNSEIAKFKKEFPNLFQMEVDTSEVGISINDLLLGIESGQYDKQLESVEGVKFPVPIESWTSWFFNLFGGEKVTGEQVKDMPIEIGPFHNKQEAIRALYKVKLVFSELQQQTSSIMDTILKYYINIGTYPGQVAFDDATGDIADIGENYSEYGGGVGTASIVTNGIGVLAALCYGVVGTAFLSIGVPLWIPTVGVINTRRRFIDLVSRHAGDRMWAKGVLGAGKWIEKGNEHASEKWRKPGWEKIKNGGYLGINRVIGALQMGVGIGGNFITTPLSWTLGGTGRILQTAENLHLDAANLASGSEKAVLIDGLNHSVGGLEDNPNNPNNNAVREILTRSRVLEFEIREAEILGELDKVKQLKKLWDKSALFSNTESFYIDVDEILHGKNTIPLTDKKAELLRKAKKVSGTIVKGGLIIQSKKEEILKRHRENVQRTQKMLAEIYKGVSFNNDTGRITVLESAEKHDRIKHIIANIDFGQIDDGDEKIRQDLIMELDEKIREGRMPGIQANHIPIEIQKIAEGYEPTFKIIEAITKKIEENPGNDNLKEKLTSFRKDIITDPNSWVLKSIELDAIITNIETTLPIKPNYILTDSENFKKEGKKLLALDVKADSTEFIRLTNIDFYTESLRNTDVEVRLGIIQNTNVGEVRGELEKYFTLLKQTTHSIDTTTPEFYFNVTQILGGKKYSSRGIGDFGDSTNTINYILTNYKDFGEVERNRRVHVINTLKTKDSSVKIGIIKSIEEHTGQKEKYGYMSDYQDILHNVTTEIHADFSQKEIELGKMLEDLRSTIGEVNLGAKDGNTQGLSTRNTQLQADISNLQREIEQKKVGGVDVVEKINLYKLLEARVLSLKQNTDKLISDIGTHKVHTSTKRPSSSQTHSSPEPTVETLTSTEKRDILLARAYAQLKLSSVNNDEQVKIHGALQRYSLGEKPVTVNGIKEIFAANGYTINKLGSLNSLVLRMRDQDGSIKKLIPASIELGKSELDLKKALKEGFNDLLEALKKATK